MAERSHWWTDRWLRSPLFLSLSFSFSDYLPTYLPIYLSIYLSTYLPIYLSIYLSYLSTYLPIYLSTYLPIYLSTYLPIYLTYLPIYLSIYLSTYLPIYLSTYLPIYLSIYLSNLSTYIPIYLYLPIFTYIYLYTYIPIYLYNIYIPIYLSLSLSPSLPPSLSLLSLSLYLSVCLSVCPVYLSICLSVHLQAWKRSYSARLPQLNNVKNETVLRDFFIFWTWQHPKRSNSARLLQFLNLTTSKTKQFCETSFKNGKLSAALTASYQCVLRFFPLHLSEVLRLPRKIDARSYEVLHLSRKIILANLLIWCSKMQPLSVNQRPDLLTSLMNMSFVLRLPLKMHLCKSSSDVPLLPSFLEMLQNPGVLLTFDKVHNPLCARHAKRHLSLRKWSKTLVLSTFWLRNVLRATSACTFSTLQLLRVVRSWCVLCILTSKCASRHSGVRFFDIATSKSGPDLMCFVHFDLEMCFAPQRRAIFHLSSGQLAPHPPL